MVLKTLRNRIKKSAKKYWKNLWDSVEHDIWSEGYKIVVKGLRGYPPALNLPVDAMEAAIHHCPSHNDRTFDCDTSDRFYSRRNTKSMLKAEN